MRKKMQPRSTRTPEEIAKMEKRRTPTGEFPPLNKKTDWNQHPQKKEKQRLKNREKMIQNPPPTYTARGTRKPLPDDVNLQNKLADRLVEWAYMNQDAYSLNEFPIKHGYSPFRFNALAKKNPYFAEALELARYVILHGMEKAILPTQGTLKWFRDHHRWWDKDYAEHDKQLTEQSKNIEKGTEIFVEIPVIEACAEVAEKEEDE